MFRYNLRCSVIGLTLYLQLDGCARRRRPENRLSLAATLACLVGRSGRGNSLSERCFVSLASLLSCSSRKRFIASGGRNQALISSSRSASTPAEISALYASDCLFKNPRMSARNPQGSDIASSMCAWRSGHSGRWSGSSRRARLWRRNGGRRPHGAAP